MTYTDRTRFDGPRQGPENEFALDVLKGAVAGAVGVWVLDRVDWFMYERALDTPESRRCTEAARPDGMDPAHAMANSAARALGVEPPRPVKDNAMGLAIHYSLGIGPGALYGALRGRVDHVDAGRGLLFGLGLFIVEDELANPLLGFAAPPQRYPWQAHARGLVAHLVYGAVTDLVLRALSPRGRPRRRPMEAPARRYAADRTRPAAYAPPRPRPRERSLEA